MTHKIVLCSSQEEDSEIYSSIQQLRDLSDYLHEQLAVAEQTRDADMIARMRSELNKTESSLLEKSEERIRAR